VLGEQLAQRDRVGGQVPVRTQLGRLQPERAHLREDAAGGELAAPPGHLAHAP
jgi:hypothetical protein